MFKKKVTLFLNSKILITFHLQVGFNAGVNIRMHLKFQFFSSFHFWLDSCTQVKIRGRHKGTLPPLGSVLSVSLGIDCLVYGSDGQAQTNQAAETRPHL